VAFHTLGCKLNYAETSTIARQFEKAGYQRAAFRDSADLYVINTCSVTENADREFRKIVNRAKRLAPESKIAVIGCYAQLKPETIVETSAVDLVLGTKEKFNILEHLQFSNNTENPLIVHESSVENLHGCIPSYSIGDRTRSFLKIQDGCDYPCTYCTIPLARGPSRSIDPEILVQQAQEIALNGVKEIVLTGVNIGDYRYNNESALLYLLQQLDQVDGIERIRISSIEPNLLSDEIIHFVSHSMCILPHFHVPLQAGSNTVLSRMKRRYDVELFQDRIRAIISEHPQAGIGVDVIVGFPGESEIEFQQTYTLLESLDISYLHVFTYSERPDTAAAAYTEKVAMEERKKRNRILTKLSEKKRQAFILSQMNQTREVLFEKWGAGYLSGMTENYMKVHVRSADKNLINNVKDIELTAFKDDKLFGALK